MAPDTDNEEPIDTFDSSEEEEEDEEEEDETLKDLINDEDEEEEESSDDDHQKKKRSHDEDDEDDEGSSSLEEDDIDLIQENLGVRIKKNKKYKRIRALSEDDSEEEDDEGKKIQNELFGSQLLESEDEEARPQELNLDLDLDEDESDSDDNFIVDDNDQPIARKTKKKGAKYDDAAMQQAQEMFGVDFDFEEDAGSEEEDDDEIEPGTRKKGAKTITEVYEPAELHRHYLTAKDEQIRLKDEPERFQLRSMPISQADNNELEDESQWIFEVAFRQPTISIQEPDHQPLAGKKSEFIKPEIKYALSCIRNERLEVPFIAAYRREYIPSLSTNFDDNRNLWTIFNLDEQWCKLRASKNSLINLYQTMRANQHTLDRTVRKISDQDIQRVSEAKNFHEIEDCRLHFQLHYLAHLPSKKSRIPKDVYQKYREENIGDLVTKFGFTPEEFGENMRDDYQRNNVVQEATRPHDEAANYLRPGKTIDMILKSATYMFSREIACHPLVRQIIRKYFFENAVLTVRPTEKGMEIDENHPCYAEKFLRNKPVTSLKLDQVLNLFAAEKDKLLEINFSIGPFEESPFMNTYHESLKSLYFSDFSSMVTKEWNDLREEAVRSAVDKQILPCLEKQLREKLIQEAQDKIVKDSCEKLNNWLNVAPYAPQGNFDDYEDFEIRNGTRICGFTFAPDGDGPCFASIVDSEGELIDFVRLPHLNLRKRPDRMSALEKQNRAKDRIKFKQFITRRKPHAVALVAATIQTKYVCQELAQILDELREHDGLPLIPIEIVDNELSNVIMKMKRSSEEFPDFPPLLLQSISNARKLNDPLSEYAKLCNPDDDILCIRFNTLQDEIDKHYFVNHLYEVFITRTNAIGVDLNRAIAHPHSADVVQFIAGLGPRKGAHLIRSIKNSSTNGQLISRQQLVEELGMTGVIFLNCAGFIKLDTDTLSDIFPDENIFTLDSTRIHPQSYGLAKKIANDALDYEEGASDEVTANSIEEILDTPEKLDDLDLGAFARQLDEVQEQGKKGYTLQRIREEFQCRYRDHREPYRAPTQEQIFSMLTNETPSTFYIGKLVTCQVMQIPRKKPGAAQLDMANPVKIEQTSLWRCPFCMRGDFADLSVVWNHFDTDDCPGYALGVRCRMDNGLSGFIPTKFLSDKEITDPSERVTIGQTIHARVIKIDTEKFSCDLTSRTSDLIDVDNKLRPPKDEYYDESTEETYKRKMEERKKRSARKPYCKRVIVHPAFENIDFKACEAKLKDMELGHAIIRPSSSGQNYLTVSWKVAPSVNQHVNIREEGKDNAFSLGHQLFIENESYEDLDEIIARFIQPMASYAREILKFKHCVQIPDEVPPEHEDVALEAILCDEKRALPSSFPYRFCPSRRLPGKFMLGYVPKNKPRIEFLSVTPQGYRFRKYYFKTLAGLIKWFKDNWNKLPQVHSSVTPAIGYDGMASLRQTFPMSQ